MRTGALAAQVWRDVRHALRAIRRSPGFSAVVVLSLGVGIGLNTAVFTWIQARVISPVRGVENSGALTLVEPRGENGAYPGASWPEFRDLQSRLSSFDALLAFRMAPFNVGAADWSERTFGLLVSGNYFSALGLQPALGRLLNVQDTLAPGGDPIVVISHEFWTTRFAADANALHARIRVNDQLLTIVGVAPRGFQGTVTMLNFDLFVPATLAPILLSGSREIENRAIRGYSALGWLKPGTTARAAQQELQVAMRELSEAYPASNRTIAGEILPFWQSPRGPQRFMVGALATLQGVLLLVLLTVCGNTANLMLARASVRTRETGIRLAIGAGRWRIASLLMTEAVVLALMGAALGAVLASWGTHALRAVPMPGMVPIKFQTSVDELSLAFTAALGLVAGVLCGLAPALHLSRQEPLTSMRAGSAAGGRSGIRDTLMVVEVALALVVLVVASVFLKSFVDTRTTDPGFTREGVLVGTYDLRGRSRAIDTAGTVDFAARLLERLRALPGVESAAIASSVPLDIHGMPARAFTVDGRARPDGGMDQALSNAVTADYFKTMRIPMLAGSDFADLRDTEAPRQAIVNEEFVRAFLSGVQPLGRRLETAGGEYVISGVVRTSRYNSFSEPPTPFLYLSYRDRPTSLGEIHIRTRDGQESRLANDVRKAVRGLDPALPVYNVRTLTDHVESNLVFQRIPARMFVFIGPLLLVLAAVGIYAVVSYIVSQRTVEIGVRLALGATGARVIGALVRDTLQVIAFGAAAGWIIAFMIDREFVRSESLNLAIYVGIPALLLGVAAAACWWPARRASRIDPVAALRRD
jgi:predicted permease